MRRQWLLCLLTGAVLAGGLLAGCGAKQRTCFDQVVACGEKIVPCAVGCAEQAQCVTTLCKQAPAAP